jgi:hypothetical protein
VCVFVYIYIYVCVYVHIYIKSNMDLTFWSHKCSEILVRGSCNHFAVTADKGPCGVGGLSSLSLYVCVCVYIYIIMCVCICIYIYNNIMDLPLLARWCS